METEPHNTHNENDANEHIPPESLEYEDASVLTNDYYEGSTGSPNHSNNNANNNSQHTHYRSLIEKRIELRRIEEEKQLTFKPNLYEYKKAMPTSNDAGSRFDKLYKDAKKRQSEIKQSPVEANTFQPTLIARSSSRGKRAPSPQNLATRLHSQTGSGNQKVIPVEDPPFQPAITRKALEVSRSGGDVTERLFQKSYEIREKQERLKAEHDQKKQDMQECTFSPQLPANTRSLSASRIRKVLSEGETAPRDPAERLYKYDELKKARMELLRKAKEEVESSEITFQPKLVASATAVGYRSSTPTQSVYERLSVDGGSTGPSTPPDVAECTFQPQISRQSAELAKSRSGEKALHDRLYEEAEKKKKDLQLMLNHVLEEEKKDVTFSPNLLTAHHVSQGLEGRKPVFERLSDSSEKKQLTSMMSQLRNELEMAECTFRPQTNVSSGRTTPSERSEIPVHARLSAEADRLKTLAAKREELRREAELKSPLLPKSGRSPSAQRAAAAASGTPIEASSSRKPAAVNRSTSNTRSTSNSRSSTASPVSQTSTPRSSSNSRSVNTAPSRFTPSPTPSMGSAVSSRRSATSPSPLRPSSASSTVTPKARYGPPPVVNDKSPAVGQSLDSSNHSATRPKTAPVSGRTTPQPRAPSASRSKPATPVTPTPTTATPKRTATTPSRTPVTSTSRPTTSVTGATSNSASSNALTPPAGRSVVTGRTTPNSSAVSRNGVMTPAAVTVVAPPANKVLKGGASASKPAADIIDSTPFSTPVAEPVATIQSSVESTTAPQRPSSSSTTEKPTASAPSPLPLSRRSPVPTSSSSNAFDAPPPHKVLRGKKKSESRDTSPVPPQMAGGATDSTDSRVPSGTTATDVVVGDVTPTD